MKLNRTASSCSQFVCVSPDIYHLRQVYLTPSKFTQYDKWQYEAPTTMDMQQHPPDVTCWVWQMTIWTSSNNGHTTTPIICHKHWVCPWTSGQETHPTLSATLTLSLQAGTSHCTNSGPLYRLFYNTFMGCRDSDAPGLFFTRVLRVGGGRGGAMRTYNSLANEG